MTIEDLKRLRDHLNVAIEMYELGSYKDMTPAEKFAFRQKFGDADAAVGEFLIMMIKGESSR